MCIGICSTLYFCKFEQDLFKWPCKLLFHFLGIRTRIYAHYESVLYLKCRELVLIDCKQTVYSECDHNGDQKIYQFPISDRAFDKIIVFLHVSDYNVCSTELTFMPVLTFEAPFTMT